MLKHEQIQRKIGKWFWRVIEKETNYTVCCYEKILYSMISVVSNAIWRCFEMFLPEKINVDRNKKKRIIQREDNIFVGYMNELQTYSDTIFHKFEIFQILWEKELKMPAVYSTNCIHLWYFYIVPGTFYLDCSSCGGSQNKKRKFMRKVFSLFKFRV